MGDPQVTIGFSFNTFFLMIWGTVMTQETSTCLPMGATTHGQMVAGPQVHGKWEKA